MASIETVSFQTGHSECDLLQRTLEDSRDNPKFFVSQQTSVFYLNKRQQLHIQSNIWYLSVNSLFTFSIVVDRCCILELEVFIDFKRLKKARN